MSAESDYKLRCVTEGLERLLVVIPKLNTPPSKRLESLIKNIETILDFINDKEDRNKW